MQRFRSVTKAFVLDIAGETSVEYSLLAAGMAAAIIAAMTTFGSALQQSFADLGRKIRPPQVRGKM